jgi:hypothetical protein
MTSSRTKAAISGLTRVDGGSELAATVVATATVPWERRTAAWANGSGSLSPGSGEVGCW